MSPDTPVHVVHQGLQIDDIGLAACVVLGLHAVVGSDRQNGTECVELCEIAIHHRVESVCRLGAGGMLVLYVVCQIWRDVEGIGRR